MLLPPPPLNEHGRLAVNAADVAEHLEYGLTSACVVCDHSALHWWRMPDGLYIPVHGACTGRLIEGWHERIESGDHLDQPDLGGARRGAYARRSSASGARVHPPRAKAVPSRSLGSPWFRPGMAEGTPWVLITETHNGRTVEVFDSREHTEGVMVRTELLAARGLPRSLGGALAVGGALLDPTGAVVSGWGEEFDLDGRPRWEPMRRVQNWMRCGGCDAVLWPLRLVSGDNRCRACVEAREDGTRVWLSEPGDPGIDSYPPEYGGPKRKKKGAKEKAVN